MGEFSFGAGLYPPGAITGRPAFPGLQNCQPGPTQVAVFNAPNYGGVCNVYDIDIFDGRTIFPNTRRWGAHSVRVGSQVNVSLAAAPMFEGALQRYQRDVPSVPELLPGFGFGSMMVIRKDNDCDGATVATPDEIIL